MNLIDPYGFPPPPLPVIAYIAPPGFDPTAQDLNIAAAYNAYSDKFKKYAFTVVTATTQSLLPTSVNTYFAYSENNNPYIVTTSGIFNWTSGSVRRHIIIMDTIPVGQSNEIVAAQVASGCEWLYCGNTIKFVIAHDNQTIKYVHLSNPSIMTVANIQGFLRCPLLTGNLTLPSNLVSIEHNAFYSCPNLYGALVIPDSVINIESGAFLGDTGFTSLHIGSSVETIADSAFANCAGLAGNLVLPDSVVSVGINSFVSCVGFTGTFIISNSLNFFAQDAINGNMFSGFISANSLFPIYDNVLYDLSVAGRIKAIKSIRSIATSINLRLDTTDVLANCFYGTLRTGALVIPDSVINIGDYSFRQCLGLTSLTIGSNVVTIGREAWRYDNKIVGVITIPNSVNALRWSVFGYCSKITGLIIGSGVTVIEDYILYTTNCPLVKSYRATPPTASTNTFNGCNVTIGVLHVPAGSLAAYRAAAYWSAWVNIVEDL